MPTILYIHSSIQAQSITKEMQNNNNRTKQTRGF